MRITPRLSWRQAITSAPFPASQRPVKATLFALVEIMTPTGELHAWRDDLLAATGLPARTLDRHLQRAVEDGWLVHEVRGGHGRRGLYRATIPASCAPQVADNSATPTRSCAPRMADNSGSCAPSTRRQLRGVVRHPAAHSRKKSASVSERVAVDERRGRRGDTHLAGDSEDQTAHLAGLNRVDQALRAKLESGERRALAVRHVDTSTTRIPHLGHCPECGAAILLSDVDECWSCRRRLDRADLLVVVDVPTIADPPADPQTAADELLAEHATQVGALPNPVRLGAHRQILGLLNEGCQPVDVRAGLTRMREKGLGLRLLPDLVAEAQSRRTARKETREPWEIA